MAVEAPTSTHMRITVHLDTGSRFEFEAEEVNTTRSVVDGRLTTLDWSGASYRTTTPVYIDLDHVIAITASEVVHDDDY